MPGREEAKVMAMAKEMAVGIVPDMEEEEVAGIVRVNSSFLVTEFEKRCVAPLFAFCAYPG